MTFRHIRISILVVSVSIAIWLAYEVVAFGASPQSIILLLYIALVIVALFLMPVQGPAQDEEAEKVERDSGVSGARKGPEEVVLNVIRQMGKVKRADLLPRVEMSKSSLVRLLDQMEKKGLIVQVGERKASFYTIPQLKT